MRFIAIVSGFIIFMTIMSNTSGLVYDVCAGMSDERATRDEFNTLFEAIHNGDCNDAVNVKTTFSLSKKDLFGIARQYGMVSSDGTPLVFFRDGTPEAMGIGAIIIYGHEGDFPVKIGDRIHIWSSGRPKDMIIEVAIEGCNPYDDKCDEICAYEGNRQCDPMCYRDGITDNVQCDIDCVDANGDGIITSADIDGICDPDCYNDDYDPNHAYDPDCALSTTKDGLCDPDSQGAKDGVCDPDCAAANRICDLDCDGEIATGNPNGLEDSDCYECDKTCNGYCSKGCTYIDKDPDCPYGFKGWYALSECCGDNTCTRGENCFTCPRDCPPNNGGKSTDCRSLNSEPDDNHICYPPAYNADYYGCAKFTNDLAEDIITEYGLDTTPEKLGELSYEEITQLLANSEHLSDMEQGWVSSQLADYFRADDKANAAGETCETYIDCESGLSCGGPEDDTRCCETGTVWDGTKCTDCRLRDTETLIVAIRSNLEEVYTADEINSLEEKIYEYIAALNDDWLGASFIYLDDESTAELVPGGKIVTDPHNETKISAVVQPLLAAQDTRYLIIIGGYNAFPQRYVGQDTAGLGHKAYSDDYYGDLDNDGIIDVPYGRFPDPNNGDIDVILNSLDTAINLHYEGGVDINNYFFTNMGGSIKDGIRFHDAVTEIDCTEDTDNCEIYVDDCQLPELNGRNFASIDLHGSKEYQAFTCNYESECECYNNTNYFTSKTVSNLDITNAVWFTMCCHGGRIDNKATTDYSIPLTFLKNSGAIYLGYTCTAIAALNCTGEHNIEIMKRVIESKSTGSDIRLGDAFIRGKNEYKDNYICEPQWGDHTRYVNQILAYYGDPTLKIKSMW